MVNFFPYFLTDDYPNRNATVQVDEKTFLSTNKTIFFQQVKLFFVIFAVSRRN